MYPDASFVQSCTPVKSILDLIYCIHVRIVCCVFLCAIVYMCMCMHVCHCMCAFCVMLHMCVVCAFMYNICVTCNTSYMMPWGIRI